MIHIFTTGGSIDKTYSTVVSDFVVGEPQIAAVLREANVNLMYRVTELLRKDSLMMDDADRQMVLEAVRTSPTSQIVITHGTDTMVDTARVLSVLTNKTIVLTGAMRPASFTVTDAVFNVGGAVMAAQILPFGVYIAMNGRVFDWDKTRKNHETNQFVESL
jgi:L-asparaginase